MEWLNGGNFHRSKEASAGWGKSSLQEDLFHVFMAIVEGFDDQLTWPNENDIAELSNAFFPAFCGCVAIADVKEFQIVKYKDPIMER